MKTTRKFWPLDTDDEAEIYEIISWDLPGYKRVGKRTSTKRAGSRKDRLQEP